MDQRIMDLPLCERPVERLIKYGPQCLSNSELLAVVLRSGNRNEGILSLANRMLISAGGLNNLLDSDLGELTEISGIKTAKASTIIAVGELVKRYRNFRSGDEITISSPKDCADLLMNEMRNLKKEILKAVILNTKGKVISIKDVSIGNLNSSIMHPREVFKDAIVKSGASIILVHNHPSGDPAPSGDDINSTKRAAAAGRIIGIELLDHIIIGEGKYISLKEKGFM